MGCRPGSVGRVAVDCEAEPADVGRQRPVLLDQGLPVLDDQKARGVLAFGVIEHRLHRGRRSLARLGEAWGDGRQKADRGRAG